mgnify:CR=1 FL=1
MSSSDSIRIVEYRPEFEEGVRSVFLYNMKEQSVSMTGADAEAHAQYLERSLSSDMASIQREYMERDSSTFWVALVGDDVAGFVGVQPCQVGDPEFYQEQLSAFESMKSTLHPDRIAELRRMHVSPKHRGKGISRLLLERFLQWCRDHQFAGVHLTTLQAMTVAGHLYRSVGFVVQGSFHVGPKTVVQHYLLKF